MCLCTNKYVHPGVYYGMLWIEWVHLEFFYLRYRVKVIHFVIISHVSVNNKMSAVLPLQEVELTHQHACFMLMVSNLFNFFHWSFPNVNSEGFLVGLFIPTSGARLKAGQTCLENILTNLKLVRIQCSLPVNYMYVYLVWSFKEILQFNKNLCSKTRVTLIHSP